MLQVFTADLAQLGGDFIRVKPSDLAAFAWLAYHGFAVGDATDEGGRDPVLVFLRKNVIDDIKQFADLNFNAIFFAHLPF